MGKLLDKIRGLRRPSRSFCAAVVVAAGHSERMGKEKLLLPLAGQARRRVCFQRSGQHGFCANISAFYNFYRLFQPDLFA